MRIRWLILDHIIKHKLLRFNVMWQLKKLCEFFTLKFNLTYILSKFNHITLIYKK